MRIRITPLALILSVALAALTPAPRSAAAQTVGQAAIVKVLPGHQMDFMEGVRAHRDWYEDAGGEWSWMVMEIVMGERTGQFVFWTPNHSYADFDGPEARMEGADESYYRNIAPHVESTEAFMLVTDEDRSMLDPDAPPAPMYEVLTFQTAGPSSDMAMEAVMDRVHDAISGMMPDMRYTVFRGAQGTDLGTWIVSVAHQDFASMAGEGGNMEEMFGTVVGEMEARGLVRMMEDAMTSGTSEVFVVRPDLSVNMN